MRERARSVEDKAKRSEDLLAAAESVALELGGVRHVTVAAVTARAGLHRTGVRRYYASKEELLLELAERGWGQWRDAVETATAGRRDLGPAEIAELLVKTVSSLPVFCDLLAHVAMTLEDDVEIDRARQYKLIAFAAHDQLVGSLQRTTTMPPIQVQTLVTATVALTASLWQTAHPSSTLAKLYEQEPDWGHYALDFEPRLTLILQATAIGLGEVLPGQK